MCYLLQRVRNCVRDDLVSAPAEVHEMVDVNWFLDGVKNVPKENKIAAWSERRAASSWCWPKLRDAGQALKLSSNFLGPGSHRLHQLLQHRSIAGSGTLQHMKRMIRPLNDRQRR